MFPTLVSFGPVNFQTLSLFSVIGFLVSGFIFWRKGREEHYLETQLFDGFLLSVLFGILIGRLGFVLLNFDKLGWNFLWWLDIISIPGSQFQFSLLGSALYLVRFARQKKWDIFEILDFWTLATALGLFFRYLGHFFDGSLFGTPTKLPWGMTFPGVFDKSHPTQLYFALFYLLLFIILSRLEYRYRTFEWYRSGKKTAQTGFLLSMFVIFNALFTIIMTWFKIPEFTWGEIVLDRWLYFASLIFGLWLLLNRSGRSLFSQKKKKPFSFIRK